MLDSLSPALTLTTYRASIHLKDRDSTALTDQISLTRSCFAAEMARGWAEIHAACVLPQAMYLVLTLVAQDDPVERLLRLSASFRTHSAVPVDWHWTIVARLPDHDRARVITEFLDMPVTLG